MLQKGSVLTSLFDAFGHQNPQKDDLGTILKFIQKSISTFWSKVRKKTPKGSGSLVPHASTFRPFSHLGPQWGPRVPPDAPGGGFEKIWVSFSTAFSTIALCSFIESFNTFSHFAGIHRIFSVCTSKGGPPRCGFLVDA